MKYDCFNCNRDFDEQENGMCPHCHSTDFASKAEESVKNFLYVVYKAAGIIWLIKRMPFLRLNRWMRIREMVDKCMRKRTWGDKL